MIEDYEDVVELEDARKVVQREMVVEDYRNAKFFVSAVYKAMWREYGHEMYENIVHSKQEQYASKNSTNVSEYSHGSSDASKTRYSQSDEDCESKADEGSTESASDQVDEDYDSEGDRE